MAPFGRPKRKVQEIQDDDISLADLPRIQAEMQTQRGSESIVDNMTSGQGNTGLDSKISPSRGTGEIEYPTEYGEPKPQKERSPYDTMDADEDIHQRRTGYALSRSAKTTIATTESERWRGTGNHKRDESRLKRMWRVSMRHLRFVGPGLVSSVAYFDPGNWTVDLAAGSEFGYKLLSVILMAGIGAAVLQVLSLRLGIATSQSLPAQIRALFLRIHEHSRVKPYRWRRRATMAGLYTLYGLAELAIIATDLAELLGSAIALNLWVLYSFGTGMAFLKQINVPALTRIFPQLPLYAGVLITAVDVLFVLAFFQRPERGRKGMLAFEGLIVSLVLCVFVCFVILIIQIKPDWPKVFEGFVPSSTIIGPKALYTSVGIIGATVMPHALFLGSHLATVDRLDVSPRPPMTHSRPFLRAFPGKDLLGMLPERWRPVPPVEKMRRVNGRASGPSHVRRGSEEIDTREERGERGTSVDEEIEHMILKDQARYEAEMNTFDRVKFASIHIGHATIDTVLSLFGFAVTINSSILILASAAFFYGGNEAVRKAGAEADLFSAHDLIEQQISKPAAFIFALALLCSGQSASITATLSGQVVSEGFIEWKTSPFVRRIVTRLLGVIPSTVVAIAVGRDGLSQMLVASQVMLSVVLPFVIAPLVYLCSRDDVMTVRNGTPKQETSDPPTADATQESALASQGSRTSYNTSAIAPPHGNALTSQLPPPIESASGGTQSTPHTTSSSSSFIARLRSICVSIFYLVRYGSLSRPVKPDYDGQKSRSFKSHWSTTAFGYGLFTVVTVANAYVLLMLMMGKG